MIALPQGDPMPPADFACRRCGACCRERGTVRLDTAEVNAIAAYLGLAESVFSTQYTRVRPDRGGLAFTERFDGACVMLSDDNHCRIQACKPWQCRTFPREWRNHGYADICAGMKESDNAK